MNNVFRATCAFAFLFYAGAAYAKAPADIADLVGAKGAGAEMDMGTRGYQNIKNNIWWNESTGTCVKVRVSQGRYASISTVSASTCGKKKSKAKATCPADVSEADRYKYPACK